MDWKNLYEYDSFGNEVKPDSKDDNPFRYCGEYYDKETEEIYLWARYYQPKMGRFLTRDTYTGEDDEPESLHLYVYCENDGVNMVDPSGHKKYATEEEWAGMSLFLYKHYNATSKCFKQKGKSKSNLKSEQKKEWINYKDGGKVNITKSIPALRVCTDGKVTKAMRKSNFYGDFNHKNDNMTSIIYILLSGSLVLRKMGWVKCQFMLLG